ncbi:MAG: retroviral-like aspartic protease family protein [Candidatus Obscuribacter sp.]|jgi:clan AA aspartic protease (TIGR02281 family)|nr:retroviral-like aspartic protease family protein [Candidatus Obscuribacter sp.]MBP6351279.1 retroviral-like aspartic protease family protein [Candidatus Obscuribacter sp.]MBP6595142.1 retroviral-like aspartic protease family protein [Candidatus Obscuribacter sp.]
MSLKIKRFWVSWALLTILSAPSAVAQSDPNVQRGIQCIQLQRYRDSVYYLSPYCQRNPQDNQASYYLALAQERLGSNTIASDLYKKIILANPNGPFAMASINSLKRLDPQWLATNLTAYQVKDGKKTTVPLVPGLSAKPQPRPTASSTTGNTGNNPASTSSDKLPREARVRFEQGTRGVKVNVLINNRPIEMIFDTGAPGICISKDQLSALGIRPPEGPYKGLTGGSANSSSIKYWSMLANVTVGAIERKNIELIVLETNPDMPLLGQTFFKDFDYTVDQSAGVLDFTLKKGGGEVNRAAYQVPFDFKDGGNRILVRLEVNDQPITTIFDTGNTASALSFSGKAQLKELGITVPDDARTAKHSGISGTGNCKLFNVRKIKLGPIEKFDMEVSVNDQESGAEAPILGQPFWADWQYSINMQRKVIEFVRRK